MSSPTQPRKGGADWLGLKDDDLDLLPPSPTREPRRGGSALSTPSAPHPASRHSALGRHSAPAGLPSSSLGAKPAPQGADSPAEASQPSQLGASEEDKQEDWLSHTLSQKKSQGRSREEHTATSKGQNLVGAVGRPPSSRYGLGLPSLVEGGPGRGAGSSDTASPLTCARPLDAAERASGSHLYPGAGMRGLGEGPLTHTPTAMGIGADFFRQETDDAPMWQTCSRR